MTCMTYPTWQRAKVSDSAKVGHLLTRIVDPAILMGPWWEVYPCANKFKKNSAPRKPLFKSQRVLPLAGATGFAKGAQNVSLTRVPSQVSLARLHLHNIKMGLPWVPGQNVISLYKGKMTLVV